MAGLSTLTFSIPRGKVPELEDRIRSFRRATSEWVRELQGQDAVYHLNLQLFPMTSPKRRIENA